MLRASAGHVPIGHDPPGLSRPESEACLDSHRSGGAEPPRWARLTLYECPPGTTQDVRQISVGQTRPEAIPRALPPSGRVPWPTPWTFLPAATIHTDLEIQMYGM